jgi:beta-lactamase class A
MTELDTYLAGQTNKTIAVAVYDFETGNEVLINPDETFHPASTIKVHVMMEVFRQVEEGLLRLEDCLPIVNAFPSIFDGSRYSLHVNDDAEQTLYPRIGENESIAELTRLMIVRSSNLATNILLEKIGIQHVDDFIRAPTCR